MPAYGVQILEDTVTPRLAAFTDRMQQKIEMELDPIGADMKDIARSLVRVRTGYLQSTIYYIVNGMVLEFGATADYASYNEFGTRKMAAQPFIRPALDASQDRIVNAILTGITDAWNV